MTSSPKEEVPVHQHAEFQSSQEVSINDNDRLGCETYFEHLPKGYYYSRFFLGSLLATGLGLWAAVASFVCPLALHIQRFMSFLILIKQF